MQTYAHPRNDRLSLRLLNFPVHFCWDKHGAGLPISTCQVISRDKGSLCNFVTLLSVGVWAFILTSIWPCYHVECWTVFFYLSVEQGMLWPPIWPWRRRQWGRGHGFTMVHPWVFFWKMEWTWHFLACKTHSSGSLLVGAKAMWRNMFLVGIIFLYLCHLAIVQSCEFFALPTLDADQDTTASGNYDRWGASGLYGYMAWKVNIFDLSLNTRYSLWNCSVSGGMHTLHPHFQDNLNIETLKLNCALMRIFSFSTVRFLAQRPHLAAAGPPLKLFTGPLPRKQLKAWKW